MVTPGTVRVGDGNRAAQLARSAWSVFARRGPFASGLALLEAALALPIDDADLGVRLRIDLASEGIDVTVVNPGFVDTPLTQKNDFDMPFLMGSDEAASRILRRIAARPATYSFPFRLSALLSISRILPGLWRKMVAPDNERQQAQSSREAGQ